MDSHTPARPERAIFLQESPYEVDGGELIGKHPREIALADLRKLPAPQSPLKAIRAKCLDCSGGNQAEVRKCTAVCCAIWPFRMGFGPYHARSSLSKSEQGLEGTSSEALAQGEGVDA